jgi:hypothetical protein
MARNLGRADRVLRVIGAVAAAIGAVEAPFSWPLRLAVFGGTATYLLLSALAGTCLGYRLMGMSTCPREQRV